MPRLHSYPPPISQQPDQQSGIGVRLADIETPTPTPTVAPCSCSGVNIFWYNPGSEIPNTYDVTDILLTSNPTTPNLPRAALVGATCPGADLSGITVAWVGGVLPPFYQVVNKDQTWALVVQALWTTTSTQRHGTLTAGGSIVCAGETIPVGPITLTINYTAGPGPTPAPTPPS